MLVATDHGIYNIQYPMIRANAATGESNISEVCSEIDRQIKEIADHESNLYGRSIDVHV